MLQTEKHRKNGRERGFTIIEMAVVLVLFGVVMSGGILGFAHFTHHMKAKATQDQFDIVFNALSTYAQRHKRLPCPGLPNGDGSESFNGRCFDNATAATLFEDTQGVVPWRELGLPESTVRDGWGRFLTYKPAPQLTVSYLDQTMQNVNGVPGDLDINDACRAPAWYSTNVDGLSVTHTHVDRAKAMFCCSTPPRDTYLAAWQGGGTLPANWRQQSIMPAGSAMPGGLDTTSVMPGNVPVQSTAAWVDVETDGAHNGDFDAPDHFANNNGPDAPMARSINSAVTLISHGGNGFMSFMRGNAANTRSMATIDAAGVNANAAMGNDEQLNVWPPQVAAATTFHPKVSGAAYDPFGRINGASDDRVAFLRTDQLYARAGSASCLRPSNFDEVCLPDTYDDVIYVLDTSGSMRCPIFGAIAGCNAGPDSRITVALNVLRETMRAHMERELRADEDFDRTGYSGFSGSNPEYTDDSAFLDVAFYQGDLDNDGNVGPLGFDDLVADGVFNDLDMEAAVALYNGGSSDYDGNGFYDDEDLIQARVDFGMQALEDRIAGTTAQGCTPVVETTQAQADTLLAAAEAKICQQLVVERDPSDPTQPLYGMPPVCNSVIAEYNQSPANFIQKYEPEPFDPANIDKNGIVLISDGNNTCGQGKDANGNPINLPNMENLMRNGQIDQLESIYFDQGQRIAEAVAAFNEQFNDAFAQHAQTTGNPAADVRIFKELHLNIADLINNPGLQFFVNGANAGVLGTAANGLASFPFAPTTGQSCATANINILQTCLNNAGGLCAPNT